MECTYEKIDFGPGQEITGPLSLLKWLNNPLLQPNNSDCIVVAIDTKLECIDWLQSITVDRLEEVQRSWGEREDIVIVRGIDTKPTQKYLDSLHLDDNRLIDSIVVDWDINGYYSDMCQSTECCDPKNPTKF